MASSNSPCAACKFLRRKCTQECVFAPYFPPDQPVKFANVHKVFGASNVAKILNELNASQREDAVNSLAYEAEARLRDPVYGCVGLISILQTRLKQVQTDLLIAKQELCAYIGQSPAIAPGLNPAFIQQYQNMQLQQQQQQQQQQPPPAMLTLQGPTGNNFRDAHHQQQVYEAHQRQLIEAAREQEMLRNFEHQQRLQDQLQQQQHQAVDLMRFNRGFDASCAGSGAGAGTSGQPQVNSSGYTQLTGPGPIVSPSLALGGGYDHSNMYQIHQHRQPEHELQHHRQQEHELQHHQQPPHEHHQQLQLLPQHLMLQHQPQQPPAQPRQGEGSEEKKSGGPSC